MQLSYDFLVTESLQDCKLKERMCGEKGSKLRRFCVVWCYNGGRLFAGGRIITQSRGLSHIDTCCLLVWSGFRQLFA